MLYYIAKKSMSNCEKSDYTDFSFSIKLIVYNYVYNFIHETGIKNADTSAADLHPQKAGSI